MEQNTETKTARTIPIGVKDTACVFLHKGEMFITHKYNLTENGVLAIGYWLDTGKKEQFAQTFIAAAQWKRLPSKSDDIFVLLPWASIRHVQMDFSTDTTPTSQG